MALELPPALSQLQIAAAMSREDREWEERECAAKQGARGQEMVVLGVRILV